MITLTPTQFIEYFPEFSLVPTSTLNQYIDEALLWLDNGYGTSGNVIARYLTAHFIVIEQMQQRKSVASLFPVNNKTVDKLSVSNTGSASDAGQIWDMIQSTSYGQKAYLYMKNFMNKTNPFAIGVGY